MIDIARIPKHLLLSALYNQMKPDKVGIFCGITMIMSQYRAAEIVAQYQAINLPLVFNQVGGRNMGVDIDSNHFNPGPYNFYHGAGTAERVIKELRKQYP
jgi:hypothetical protein